MDRQRWSQSRRLREWGGENKIRHRGAAAWWRQAGKLSLDVTLPWPDLAEATFALHIRQGCSQRREQPSRLSLGRRETLGPRPTSSWPGKTPLEGGRAPKGGAPIDSGLPSLQAGPQEASHAPACGPALTPRPGTAWISWQMSRDTEWQPEHSPALTGQQRNQSPQGAGAPGGAGGRVCERHAEAAQGGRHEPETPREA